MKKWFLVFLAALFLVESAAAGDIVINTVNYTPTPAIPGEQFTLFVHLKNNSKYVSENVQFELDLSGGRERDNDFPFSLGTGVSKGKTVATIDPYKTVLLEYIVYVDSSALDGDYNLTFRFKEAQAQKEHNYTIKVLSRKPDMEIVGASKTEAAPGQVVEIDLTLRNVGTSLARDVLAGIEESRTVTTTGVVVEREFSSLGASFAFVKSVDAGKETTARITLAVNPEAEQKAYTIPITLKYKDNNANSYSETTYIGLKVVQEPELDAVISEIEPAAFPGGDSEASVDLFNIGIGTAKYVVAEVSTDAAALDQQKVFIGTLEADDFDSFKVKMKINSGADPAGDNSLKLVLKYKNQYGEERQVEKSLKLNIQSAAEAQAGAAGPVVMVLGIIPLLLMLVGLFVTAKWIYRRFVKRGQ